MSVISQMKLLVSLAQIDGVVAEREKNYIVNIGLANNMDRSEIEQLLEQRHDLSIPEDLTPERKFEYIFSLIQLMKIDEKMYKEEILFCSKIAAKLGYNQQIMFDLMLNVKAAAMDEDEVNSLRELTRRYLN